MASSSNKKADIKTLNWSELPSELTYLILQRLGAVEILESVQKVCTSWRRVSKDPSIWRKIDMQFLNRKNRGKLDYKFERMTRMAVDRSDGCLEEIKLGKFANASLLNYIVNRSSNLRSITIDMYFLKTEDLVNAFTKLPLLEELEISHALPELNLKAIGIACPRLKTLKMKCFDYYVKKDELDDDAYAIVETMPQLNHLQLYGNRLTETGLIAILDNCNHLEYLDLRKCVNFNLVGEVEERCFEKIKVVRRPNDSTDDIPFCSTTSIEDGCWEYILRLHKDGAGVFRF